MERLKFSRIIAVQRINFFRAVSLQFRKAVHIIGTKETHLVIAALSDFIKLTVTVFLYGLNDIIAFLLQGTGLYITFSADVLKFPLISVLNGLHLIGHYSLKILTPAVKLRTYSPHRLLRSVNGNFRLIGNSLQLRGNRILEFGDFLLQRLSVAVDVLAGILIHPLKRGLLLLVRGSDGLIKQRRITFRQFPQLLIKPGFYLLNRTGISVHILMKEFGRLAVPAYAVFY